MNYNFDQIINRRHTFSVKWDERDDIPADTIPMWVADMDFKAASVIMEALQRRLDQGVFGYTHVQDEYYEAIDRWFSAYHNWSIRREQVIYTTGVVPALSAIIKGLAGAHKKVIIQPPVYNCFFSSVRNNDCQLWENPLLIDGNTYRMDYDDLEKRASDPDCSLMVLCNPHNPAGRVWTKDELKKVAEICARNKVTVLSDEIHCELAFEGHPYTPFATVANGCRWVSCVSPSKAFNIAGLHIANIVCGDADIYNKVDRAINDNEVCDVNPFGVTALIAAYNGGRPWLMDLLNYLQCNYEDLASRFAMALPELKVFALEGTYLAWVDCRAIAMSSVELEEYLIREAHVWLNPGSMYGSQGEGFLRINLACPRQVLNEAIDRLIPVLEKLIKR